MKKQAKAYILAVSAVLLWSTVATAFKIALQKLDYVQLLWLASGTTMVVMLVILFFRGQLYLLGQINAKSLSHSAILGFLNPFMYYIVLFKAYSLLPAQVAQPLNYIWPVVLVLLAAPILKQSIRIKSIIALLVSFLGVVIISTQGNILSLHINEPFGVVLAAGSSIIWSLFWLLNVRDKRPEIIKLFWNFVFGFLFTSAYLFLFSSVPVFSWQAYTAGVYVGFFEMGFTFALWLSAMQLTESADKISNLVFLSPFISLIFIHFILGETIYFTTYIGIFVILAGICIQQCIKEKKNAGQNNIRS